MIVRSFICLLILALVASPCVAQQQNTNTDKLPSAEVLKANLYAKTDDERQFCDYVIQKRNDGTIPIPVLYGVYQKALAKDRGRRFAYFKSGLELVCKQKGIVLNAAPDKTLPTSPSTGFPSFKVFFRRGT